MNCPICNNELVSMPSKINESLGKKFVQKAWICASDNLTVLQNVPVTDIEIEIIAQNPDENIQTAIDGTINLSMKTTEDIQKGFCVSNQWIPLETVQLIVKSLRLKNKSLEQALNKLKNCKMKARCKLCGFEYSVTGIPQKVIQHFSGTSDKFCPAEYPKDWEIIIEGKI